MTCLERMYGVSSGVWEGQMHRAGLQCRPFPCLCSYKVGLSAFGQVSFSPVNKSP